MRKTIFSLLIALCTMQLVNSQNVDQDILLTIDGNKITRAEFERIYTKNNQEPAFDSASLDEYMKLFVNFKLKVIESEALGMDTLKSFTTEFKGYRAQLEKPFFTDTKTDEALIVEAYERMKWNVRASHILIKCGENTLAADTLKAYNKIFDIRKRAIKGEGFNKLAKQYSQDPSAVRNGGDLGFFSAFSMVYPFETAAYNTPVGEISNIIRTKFGYHILKVTDKKEDRGQVKVAHLMLALPKGTSVVKENQELKKINAIYDSIQAGADFVEMVVKYSDDRGTSKKGGELPYFGAGRMIPEFEKAAFALAEIGDVSKPIKTAYGYHIIKLLDVKSLGSLEEVRPTIISKISKDVRAKRGKEMVISRLKREYNLKVYNDAFKPFYSAIDSSIYNGKWDAAEINDLNETLFTLSDSIEFTQQDFAESILNDGKRRASKPLPILIEDEFDSYIDKSVVNYEKSRLEVKYPEFKHLVKEYHDGILLFNLTDEMVWSKAVKDTTGLDKFYSENKNNYMWSDRVEATIYTINKKEWESKVAKLAVKVGKKSTDIEEAKVGFMKKASVKDSTLTFTVTMNKYSKGDDDIIDAVLWEPGVKPTQERDGSYIIVYVNRAISPEPKLLNEARGLITADYQTYLEKQWMIELHNKYKVEINEDVLKSMIK